MIYLIPPGQPIESCACGARVVEVLDDAGSRVLVEYHGGAFPQKGEIHNCEFSLHEAPGRQSTSTGAMHPCAIPGCPTRIPVERLMCAPHWRMVPRALQQTVWKAYRPGQESDHSPSCEWMCAAKASIHSVCDRIFSNDPQPELIAGATVMYFAADPKESKAAIESALAEHYEKNAELPPDPKLF